MLLLFHKSDVTCWLVNMKSSNLYTYTNFDMGVHGKKSETYETTCTRIGVLEEHIIFNNALVTLVL